MCFMRMVRCLAWHDIRTNLLPFPCLLLPSPLPPPPQELGPDERKRGTRASRKLSAASSVKKQAGSETRAVITRLLELNQLSQGRYGKGNEDEDEEEEGGGGRDDKGGGSGPLQGGEEDKKGEKKDTETDTDTDADSKKSSAVPGKLTLEVPALTPAPSAAASPAAPASAPKGSGWFGFGKKTEDASSPRPAGAEGLQAKLAAATKAADNRSQQGAPSPRLQQEEQERELKTYQLKQQQQQQQQQEEEDWSSDEDWDVVKAKLQVRERQDRFYIYSNVLGGSGEVQDDGSRYPANSAVPPLDLAVESSQSGKPSRASAILKTHHPSMVASPGMDGKIIVNCLDVSLNRFRFLDFAEASPNINWSVRHIVALNLSGNLLVSLEGIAACQHLRVLSCNDNLLTSMTPLKGCKFLRRLKISGNRLTSLSLLNEQDLSDYYLKFAKVEGDIDINDFDDEVRGPTVRCLCVHVHVFWP